MINTKSKPKIYQKFKIIIANNNKIQLKCHLKNIQVEIQAENH